METVEWLQGQTQARDAVLKPVQEALREFEDGEFYLHAQFAFCFDGAVWPTHYTSHYRPFERLMEVVRRFEPMTWEIRYSGYENKKMPDGFCVAYSRREPRYTVPEMREWEKRHAQQ